jgi:hypothetical protein
MLLRPGVGTSEERPLFRLILVYELLVRNSFPGIDTLEKSGRRDGGCGDGLHGQIEECVLVEGVLVRVYGGGWVVYFIV